MIDRDRYHESQDYRDGYDHGLIDGKRQTLKEMFDIVNIFQKKYDKLVEALGEQEKNYD